ncbi:Ribosome small subunit-stimulated GTPase EngC [Croceitalea dokdonensis DOKDO 023]|uniref:Small ribosomal subunit biogenesis GTPase RsgA n=1 Tax=Croceitalea dokdonensis DOKDO 023 TaxID=1300341 RepID=A0A0P7B0F8_9FLAO|nr:ribosome small subunit-dependent GTPase A [Croceitalea dokdonensis]KPM32395.1 Ribosome small subunit-stimulated GTPase EngC [Croceitalea dokdonensis DOKDO 023]
MLGTVYKSTGSWYTVKSDAGAFYQCRIKGKFRIKGIKSTNPIAVGDRVDFQLEKIGDEEVGIISKIHDRRNYIIRKSVNLSKQTHIIAANLDLVFLVVTLNNPTTYTSFIDRFLVTAEAYDIPAILLFNKLDSYTLEERSEVHYLSDLYQKIGYTCIQISAKTGKNIAEVKTLMQGKTSMFSGNSGVGKSTLVNAIENGLDLKTAEISDQHLQGQHTTTFAEMYDLSFDARIIDTPGIRGFGVVDIEKEELGDYFPEFFALKTACKFNNCLHLDEPKCAVKKALDDDGVSWSRYRSYAQMALGEDENYRVDIHKDHGV